jgi:D-arabinose 1-dehydrogenase-like Zn-dependent alcohol dehydrogenase
MRAIIVRSYGGPETLTLLPGQDPHGGVAEVGEGVGRERVGQRIVVSSRLTCGVCEFCDADGGSDCRNSRHSGIHRWIGYADILEAMAAAGAGMLKANVGLVMPLDKLLDAFALLHERKVAGKIVIDPSL